MKKEAVLSVILVIFLLTTVVIATPQQGTVEELKTSKNDPKFWSSSEFVSGASAADVGVAFKNGFISTDNIGLLDGFQLVGNEVYLKDKIFDALTDKQVEPIIKNLDSKQLSNLKDSQVSKTSLNSLSSKKWSSLKRETLSSVLSRESGRVVDVQLGSDGVGGEVTATGFKIKKASFVAVDDMAFTNNKIP